MGCSNSDTNGNSRPHDGNIKGGQGSGSYEPFVSKIKTSLNDYKLPIFNHFALKVNKYFKNQLPPKEGEEWVDDIFPPIFNSIVGKDKDGNFIDKDKDRLKDYKSEFYPTEGSVIWKRAKDIFNDKYYIILDGFSMNDINQGEIGNCYLMSSLSSLANYPQLLAEVFRGIKVKEKGAIEVVLRIDGEWQIVLIDDYFPCSPETGKLIYAHPLGNELWVPIIEKAWAKVNGGYMYINAGSPTEVLEAMTSFPIIEQNHTSDNFNNIDFWKILIEGTEKKWMMTCICPSSNEADELGLPTGHVYTFIEARESIVDGTNYKLARLRNPWGSISWKGKFNDNDKVWTETMLTAFHYNKDSDTGDFWMDYQDYCRIFIETEICKTMHFSASKSLKLPKNVPMVYEFQISVDSEVFFQVFRNFYRFNKGLLEMYNMPIHILLIKKNRNSISLVKSSYCQIEDAQLTLNLTAGSYLVYCYVNANNSDASKDLKNDLTNILYVTCNNYFEIFDKGEDKNHNLLKSVYANHAYEATSKDTDPLIIKNYIDSDSELCYNYIKNISKNLVYNFKINFINKHTEPMGNPLTTFSLPPGAEYIALGSTIDCYESHSFNYTQDVKEELFMPSHNEWFSKLNFREIDSFLVNCQSVETNQEGYCWIHVKHPIDFSKLTS